MLASGIVDLVLAAIILAGLPGTAAWAIGLLVGINMVMGGVALGWRSCRIDQRRAAEPARTASAHAWQPVAR